MPKFRTDEPPEQSQSGFIGIAIVGAMVVLTAILCARKDLTESHQLQTHVFLPEASAPSQK